MPLPFSVNGRQAGAALPGVVTATVASALPCRRIWSVGRPALVWPVRRISGPGSGGSSTGQNLDPGGAGPGVGDAGERGAAQVDHVGGTARAQVDDLGPHPSAGALHGEVAAAGGAAAEPLRRQAHIAPAGRKGAERATAQRIARVIEHRHGRRPSQVAAAARAPGGAPGRRPAAALRGAGAAWLGPPPGDRAAARVPLPAGPPIPAPTAMPASTTTAHSAPPSHIQFPRAGLRANVGIPLPERSSPGLLSDISPPDAIAHRS